MTTGRATPGLTYERWLPSCLAKRKPAAIKTASTVRQCSGTNLGIKAITLWRGTSAARFPSRLGLATHHERDGNRHRLSNKLRALFPNLDCIIELHRPSITHTGLRDNGRTP